MTANQTAPAVPAVAGMAGVTTCSCGRALDVSGLDVCWVCDRKSQLTKQPLRPLSELPRWATEYLGAAAAECSAAERLERYRLLTREFGLTRKAACRRVAITRRTATRYEAALRQVGA